MRSSFVALVCLGLVGTARADEPGAPYKVEVVLADAVGIAAIPAGVVGLYFAAGERIEPVAVFASVPVCIVSPVLHLVHHRPLAALASFLGWSASAALTWTLLFGLRGYGCGLTCEPVYSGSAALALPSAVIGSTAMLFTDAALAHDMRKPSAFRITPNGFAGTF